MSIEKKFGGLRKPLWPSAGLVLLTVASGAGAQAPAIGSGKTQAVSAPSKFYCNIRALSPAEHARHTQLTDKLLATRKDVVESEKGYEFQYSPKEVSLSEIVEWVEAESKCCPFFDFHIDVENEGTLLCLRLTGAEGVKAFVRSEFHVGK